jgi:hypothetical protein
MIQWIERNLVRNYVGCDVHMFLVGLRYYNTHMIPPNILHKYRPITNHVCGVNEYLQMFGIEGFQDELEYKQFVNEFVQVLFGDV